MTEHATSADGTRIAFDRIGQGPVVVLVGGMFCDRQATRGLAEALAAHCTVINYDRRGRGDSGDTPPYSPEREVEDIAALIAEAGGSAAVYGHSSGAGLAATAAASGIGIARLVLHEPPYGPDDAESRRSARTLAERVAQALAEDRRGEALMLFFEESGMDEQTAQAMAGDRAMRAIAPTMPYDFAVIDSISRGGVVPEDRIRAITAPTLVLSGDASEDFMRDACARVAALLDDGRHTVLPGQDHAAPPEAVAPVVAGFLAGREP
jgi:pimeloyl-ACP methyl ester carboxylesterase